MLTCTIWHKEQKELLRQTIGEMRKILTLRVRVELFCKAEIRKSCVFLSFPTLNKFMSLCRIQETTFFPKFTTEQIKNAVFPLRTDTFLEVISKSKWDFSSIDGISEVLLKILRPWLCSCRRSLSFREWLWMFVIDATPNDQPYVKQTKLEDFSQENYVD